MSTKKQSFVKKLLNLPKKKFASKLFISYIILMLIPLIIILTINFRRTAKNNREQALFSSRNAIRQTAAFVEYKVFSIDNILNIIASDDTLQTLLKTADSYSREHKGSWIIQTTDMKKIIYSAYISREIQDVQIYMLKGSVSFEHTPEFNSLSQLEKEDWIRKIDSAELFDMVWFAPEFFGNGYVDIVSAVKKVPNFNSINRHIGIMKANISTDIFQEIISQGDIIETATTILCNSQGAIVSFSGKEEILNGTDIPALINLTLSSKKDFDNISILEESYLVSGNEIKNSDWILLTLIPEKDLFYQNVLYREHLLVSFFSIVILAIPLTFFTSKSITKRISALENHMQETENNNFVTVPIDNGADEIGMLTITFNKMSERIRTLLNEQYSYGYEIKNLEYRLLQSQINPHFLYNTLDTIYWLAKKDDATETARAIQSFAKFYKLSLGRGEHFNTLKKEIEHVKAYVELQNIRFENKIQLEIDIRDEMLEYNLIKTILQPLVENAIIHGILENDPSEGKVKISAFEDKDFFNIVIEDNGIGMSKKELDNILQLPRNSGGYGIWNSNQRIKLIYGEDYGISYVSQGGTGTTVIVKLPKSI